MSKDEDRYCQVHPENEATAKCMKFNRRFCDLDFEPDAEQPAQCFSEGTYCEYRSQCLVWEKLRQRKRQLRQREQEGKEKFEEETGTEG